MATSERDNPYVGPAAFSTRQKDLFFGREREAKKLLSLISSTNVALFYAPSGAGKSSLLNARLIPALQEKKVDVLPVARVGGEAPQGLDPRNVYVFNALSYLSQEDKDPHRLERLQNTSFLEYFTNGEKRPRVMILDQFEEIVTAHPEHREQREEFFQDIRATLETVPLLSVVFSMREDHIAALDRYAPLLPDRLRGRFQMERLRHEAAVTAVRRPAEAAGRPFATGVSEQLIENLSQERIGGRDKTTKGEFVEPVQLQVVCFQLWEDLKKSPGAEITEEDLQNFGDVDRTLVIFYEEALSDVVQATGVSEVQIRRWFGETLINPSRLRSQVSQTAEDAGGLPNEAVRQLENKHLIRAENIRGGTWFELIHDRFINPVLVSNERWLPEQQIPLLVDAEAWKYAGGDASFLYQGQQLAEGIEWARANRGAIGELARKFLEDSGKAEGQRATQQARSVRKLWSLAGGLAIALIIVLLLFMVNLEQMAENKRERRLSESQALAIAALNALPTYPRRSLNLSLQAALKTHSPDGEVAPVVEVALHRSLHASRARPISSRQVGEIWAFALSTDGQRLATTDGDGNVTIGDTDSGATLLSFSVPSPVWALAFSPDAAHLATLVEAGNVGIWDVRSPPQEPLSEIQGRFTAITFSPDGKHLVIAREDTDVEIRNGLSGALERTLFSPTEAVYALAYSPDGTFLATVGEEETNIWKVSSGKIYRTFSGYVIDAVFSPDGRFLTTVTENGTKVWNIDATRGVVTLHDDSGWRQAVFSRDGRCLATLDQDMLRMWELFPDPAVILTGHAAAIAAAIFSPDGEYLASVSTNGNVKLWDVDSGREESDLTDRLGSVGCLAFSPNGKLLAVAPLTGEATWEVSIRHTASWEEVLHIPAHDDKIQDLAFSPDSKLLATASDDGATKVWDTHSGRQRFSMPNRRAPVHAVTFSPDGRYLATAGMDTKTEVWDARTGALVCELKYEQAVHDLAFSPSGESLATASADRTARVWDARTGAESLVLRGHTGKVRSVAFSRDGNRLATGGGDRTVRMWDTHSGQELFKLPGSTRAVSALAFSPDGRRLAVASESKSIRLELLAVEDLIHLAQERIGSPDQRRSP